MPPPDRWQAYRALGCVIEGTRFIAFKVPLKEEICKNLPENESFTPEQLIRKIEESGKRLGLVVDLTFTTKYYNGQYFTKRDIQYEKIFTKGHDIPSDDVVQRFVEVVNNFSSRNTAEDVVIGVHCTHGVNRTGYIVCRYMIENLNMDPKKAVALFGEARGHPIERENYLNDLMIRPLSSDCTASPWQNNDTRGDPNDHTYYGQQMHSRLSHSGHFSPKENFGKREHGRAHSHTGHFSKTKDRSGESSPSMQCGASRGDLVYSSPLEHFDAPAQSTWGNVARSGWGPTDSRGQGYRAQGFSRGRNTSWDSHRDYHDHRQKYSWRKSDGSVTGVKDSNRSQSYRDRAGDVHDRSHQNSFTGNRQGNRGRYRHQRNTDDNSSHQESGWGRRFSAYQGNPRGDNNQYGHSGGYHGRGCWSGQMYARGGWSAGWNSEHKQAHNPYNWNS